MLRDPRSEEIRVSRDCPAASIPYGAPVTIEAGCMAQITQQLGGAYTVLVEGNLYRIEGKDADALGLEPTTVRIPRPKGAITAQYVQDMAWEQLATCYDPEIPVDIVSLGLVYGCNVTALGEERFRITCQMTLTAPGCGMGTMIADEARVKLQDIPGVKEAVVDLVWDPPWSRDRMSESARLQLGML